MKIITLSLLLAALRAGAVENIECEWALAKPREVTVGRGHVLTLQPGQVLFRGALEMLFSRSTEHVYYSVRDEMGARKVFSTPLKSVFPLEPGDQVFFLDPTGQQVRATAYYGEATEERTVRFADGERVIRPNRPLFLHKPTDRVSRLTREEAQNVFKKKTPVVVVRTLNAENYEKLRERVMPDIRAFEAHQKNAARFYAVTAAETCELAHFEVAHAGALKWKMLSRQRPKVDLGGGKFRPALTVYELALTLRKAGGEGLTISDGDLVYFIDEENHVLMKYERREKEIILYEPYDAFERQLCEVLAFAKKAVVVRPRGT